jgi:hypothetical protein
MWTGLWYMKMKKVEILEEGDFLRTLETLTVEEE